LIPLTKVLDDGPPTLTSNRNWWYESSRSIPISLARRRCDFEKVSTHAILARADNAAEAIRTERGPPGHVSTAPSAAT